MIEAIGADVYKSWSDDQRKAEIAKLVEGYRSGRALKILLQMATAIAGSPEAARDHLRTLITAEERHLMVNRQKGEDQTLAAAFLM